jgi:hypothetical protein
MTVAELDELIFDEVAAALTQVDHSMRMTELRDAAAVAFAVAYEDAGGAPESYDQAQALFLNTLNSAAAHTFPDGTDAQAERISSILATAAFNAASVAAAPRGSQMEWVTMLDDKVREIHRPLHGEVRAAGTPFIVDGFPLEYPGQPIGPPEVWINCRCTLRASLTAATEHIEIPASDLDGLLSRAFDAKKRKAMAKANTAMPDGSFPIANAEDLKNAIQAIGRAKDPAKAKAHIRRRAKALGLSDLISESWTASGEVLDACACEEVEEIVAAPGTHDGPGWLTNPRDTQRLRDYWTKGAGAAKIGWGSPNDLTRCAKYLGKYVGPQYAWGTCQNLHKTALGIWNPESRGHRRRIHAAADIPDDQDPAIIAMIDAAFAAADELEELMPPSHSLFEDPGLDAPTPLTVISGGDYDEVVGHLAAPWDTCHVGISGACVNPPRSATNYAHFRTGEVETDQGPVPVGHITAGTGHAPTDLTAADTVAHYDNTGTVVADVAVGEDEHGIWAHGIVRPGVTDEQKYALRAGAPSGDWRRLGGNLELVGALIVNVPGFPIPRPELAASAGRDLALVAAGVVTTDPNAADPERVAVAVIARLDQREADRARRVRAAQLASQINALRVQALTSAVR